MGKPCGQVAGPVEGGVEAVLDLLGKLVLERGRQPVGLGPAVAEHVGQETLDDAVAPDHAHGPPAAGVGQLHPVIGGVHGQAPVGQLLDRGGHGAGRHLQGGGQVPGPGPRASDGGWDVRRQIAFSVSRSDFVRAASMIWSAATLVFWSNKSQRPSRAAKRPEPTASRPSPGRSRARRSALLGDDHPEDLGRLVPPSAAEPPKSVIQTEVPSGPDSNRTSSTSERTSGMPRPRSKFSRSGSVTGGCSGSRSGSKPRPESAMQTSSAPAPPSS